MEKASGEEGEASAVLVVKASGVHASDCTRSHLGFSKAVHELAPRFEGGDDSTREAEAWRTHLALLRRLIAASPYGDRPPGARPEEVERRQYVRELCMQVGLSLDVVRLAFLERKAAGGIKRPTQVLGREERTAMLERAGRYMLAVQFDMERLHEEFSKLEAEAEASKDKADQPGGPVFAPSFGAFIGEELLPLYISDIPFHVLRTLIEHHTGLPLDGDDEQKAWKVRGLEKPQRLKRAGQGAEKCASKKRPREEEQPERIKESLAEAFRALKPKGGIRMQMTNSVMERRRLGLKVRADVPDMPSWVARPRPVPTPQQLPAPLPMPAVSTPIPLQDSQARSIETLCTPGRPYLPGPGTPARHSFGTPGRPMNQTPATLRRKESQWDTFESTPAR